jgi:hypothetical protein
MPFSLSYDEIMHTQPWKKTTKSQKKKQPSITTNHYKKLHNYNRSLQTQENQRVSELMD